MPNKDEILDYLRSLKPELQEIGINKIGLFGSYAKGTNDIASDIDITIESNADVIIKKTGSGINALMFLDDLRQNIQKKFKISVDLCDTATMSKEKKDKILAGVIYV
ncbi:MAG: nucleotidyltransferase domain-containing protein [Campylobacter sputorum]|uniref:nucleotidyltransferase family protein n=1 Tax=Campylobacter sputorum TaxID=206 RepID=UPI000B76E575|nr:nucleotidyltransferase domain-containing protein [Campylobacter sputorum]ASM37992.1 nucleotidyl transferase domain protein [Campylobacter sputorum bv. paraureolyticus LMG 11764]MDY6121036.1 nucleotidyltransferase domain-containing protein [Campylobacter sputorum]